MDVRGRVNSIETLGTLDGPGIRTVIFLQGCPFTCGYCHNPDTWDKNGGVEYSVSELFKKILRYVPYYRKHGGLTLSGGEPLWQTDFAAEIFRLCKENGISTTLDTSAAVFNEKVKNVLAYTDLVIADVKALDRDHFREVCGGSFNIFKKFLDYCQETGQRVWLRQVIIGGINDTPSNILAIKDLAAAYSSIEKIELLAYHTDGLGKWQALGKEYPLSKVKAPDEQTMANLRSLL